MVAQVPRVVPRARWVVPHTSYRGCQSARPIAPGPHTNLFPGHQANRAGGRDSTGPGAVPASMSKQPDSASPEGEEWLLDLDPLVGSSQGHGVWQDPVPSPHWAVQDLAVLPAEGTAWGRPWGLRGVPGVLE